MMNDKINIEELEQVTGGYQGYDADDDPNHIGDGNEGFSGFYRLAMDAARWLCLFVSG